MYGLVTVWTSMDDGPYWVILLKYESHDMRHTGFHRLRVVNGTPGFWGITHGMPDRFYVMSGQKVNPLKSSICFSEGVEKDEALKISRQ